MMPPYLDEAVVECLRALRDVYGVPASFCDVVRAQFEVVYTQGKLDGVEIVGERLGDELGLRGLHVKSVD